MESNSPVALGANIDSQPRLDASPTREFSKLPAKFDLEPLSLQEMRLRLSRTPFTYDPPVKYLLMNASPACSVRATRFPLSTISCSIARTMPGYEWKNSGNTETDSPLRLSLRIERGCPCPKTPPSRDVTW
jgi:hypothetical protein